MNAEEQTARNPENMMPIQNPIFVVDDDLAVRESLKFMLELEGLTVNTCGSVLELLHHPDLVHARCLVIDYKTLVTASLEGQSQLATHKTHLPVILTTSIATSRPRRCATAAGVWTVLEKPLLDGALIENIHEVLSFLQFLSTI